VSQDDYVAGKIPYLGVSYDKSHTVRLSHEWDKMPEGELMEYLRIRPTAIEGVTTGGSLVCHGPTLNFVREFGKRAEEILIKRRLTYTVREDEDSLEEGGPRWWRTITLNEPYEIPGVLVQ